MVNIVGKMMYLSFLSSIVKLGGTVCELGGSFWELSIGDGAGTEFEHSAAFFCSSYVGCVTVNLRGPARIFSL